MRDRGAILVMTLWVLALLSLLAFAMVARARGAVRDADHAATERRCRELLATLAQMSLARLAYDENASFDAFREEWGQGLQLDGSAALDGFGDLGLDESDFALSVAAADECAKIGVNEAPPALLAQALREIGAPESIAEAIVDWRDADTLGAAEGDAYAEYAPPNKPLEHIEKLLFVQGVTPEIFFGEDGNHNGALDPEEDDESLLLPRDNGDGRLQVGLMDLFTVYGDGTINLNTCSLPVLRTLLAYAAPAFNADAVAQTLVERRCGPDACEGTGDDHPFESAADIEEALGEELFQACDAAGIKLEVVSGAFRFYLRVTIPSENIRREADMLVLRDGETLRVAAWHDGQ
ncbi:MAG: type II secretion system protein GspK [FCB group bacterium]|nr:type II secretion system protein GspK [FCB group bacterium]